MVRESWGPSGDPPEAHRDLDRSGVVLGDRLARAGLELDDVLVVGPGAEVVLLGGQVGGGLGARGDGPHHLLLGDGDAVDGQAPVVAGLQLDADGCLAGDLAAGLRVVGDHGRIGSGADGSAAGAGRDHEAADGHRQHGHDHQPSQREEWLGRRVADQGGIERRRLGGDTRRVVPSPGATGSSPLGAPGSPGGGEASMAVPWCQPPPGWGTSEPGGRRSPAGRVPSPRRRRVTGTLDGWPCPA